MNIKEMSIYKQFKPILLIIKKLGRKLKFNLNTLIKGRYFTHTEKRIYEKKLLENGYNFALRDGNGDSLLTIAAIPAFEKLYKAKVKLFIKPSQEYLMKMFNITDYVIVETFVNKILYPININKTSFPQKGDIWFVNVRYNKETIKKSGYECFNNFKEEILNLLNLPLNTKLSLPANKLEISEELNKKINFYNSLDKTILFIPEANSVVAGDLKYWEKLASLLQKSGYCVISNVICKEHYLKNASLNENFKMEDLIALGFSCKAVVSIRNGMCDILNSRGKNLFVFDTSQTTAQSKKFFNVNAMYDRNDVNEYYDENAISPEELAKKILGQ